MYPHCAFHATSAVKLPQILVGVETTLSLCSPSGLQRRIIPLPAQTGPGAGEVGILEDIRVHDPSLAPQRSSNICFTYGGAAPRAPPGIQPLQCVWGGVG